MNEITVRGARMHNLKNIDLTIPRGKLVVFTGLSGSGKSSLAFDTLYAEGHRRFVESLSSYARMFLGQLDKPDVDSIEGLSPAIAIDQKTTSKNPRSTVGTVTEIYDYLRLLYARIGVPHCPICGREIRQSGVDQIIDSVMEMPEGERFMVLSPVVRGKKGRHEKIFASAMKSGYVRARVDGVVSDIVEDMGLDKNKKHTIELVIDRLVMRDDIRTRLSDSVETALRESDGDVMIVTVPREGEGKTYEYSTRYACPEHGVSIGELEPRLFSFNNPFGACPHCLGIGVLRSVSPEKIMPNKLLSLAEGGLAVNGFKTVTPDSWNGPLVAAVGKKYGFTLDTPLCEFPPDAMHALLWGTGEEEYDVTRYFGKVGRRAFAKWEGVIPIINSRVNMNSAEADYYQQFMEESTCPECGGKRLNPSALSVRVGGMDITALCDLSICDALDFINSLTFTPSEEMIAREIMKELRSRLGFLINVGLDYLTLSRRAGTLSGGEAQRIRLATQIGSALTGVMYVLDEPSIGLHQRDNSRLIATLKHLRDLGNSVLVVEHDEETMASADHIVDIGPGAGVHGGEVIFSGTPEEIRQCKDSVTGAFLTGQRQIAVPNSRRAGNGKFLSVYGAEVNNLKKIDVKIPLGCFVCVTGVSGSGKSSLVNGIVYPALARKLNRASTWPGKHRGMDGIDALDKVIAIDQSPIGRTPRSNPATYTGLFNDIRELFAKTPAAKMRGYAAGRFSFNTKGGRCEACEGDGVKRIEMHFLPDVYVKCDVCHGSRYNRDTLEVKYKGKSIADVLDMTVEEACDFFADIPRIANRVRTIHDVGLGYVKLGQAATTLSGGEAQRVKLATELSKRSTGKTFYVLDEPTTGLHSADVERLIAILQRLVDAGNTVLVIEHNLDVIKVADHIIDMGPEGGDAGGTVIAQGTPEEVAQVEKSYTGQFLREKLGMKQNGK
ncbi:MAG: excinuclease ABC subunit UvrA [Clostridia bacterium]|nr:excinuclease ABC subunit UvrA [Clostridia bacterium]